jgi:hypothetical protein
MVMSGSWCAGCNQGYKLEKVNPRSLFLSLANRHSWARTSMVGIRAINEYLKKDPVTTIYQEMSTTMQEIQHSFGSTIHNRITPTPSLAHSDSQLVHLGPPVSACSLSGDHREARTKRRRICLGSDRDSRIGHRRGGCKHMLDVRGRTTGNIPSLQEAGVPIDSSSGMGVPSLQPHLTRRIDETDFPQAATQTVILERSDAVQNTGSEPSDIVPRCGQGFLPPEAEQGSIGATIPLLDSQESSNLDLTSWQPFPNTDPCWTFPNVDSGWTYDTWLSPFSNSDPNFFSSY